MKTQLISDHVVVRGTIEASGRGPLSGRGAGIDGSGGSYGGSGGIVPYSCGNSYFSVYENQIGSFNVFSDVTEDSVMGGLGSGGSKAGSGHGGGLIMLEGRIVDISNGRLLSAGSRSSVPFAGSGSGGGISIVAVESIIGTDAVVSVPGGDAVDNLNITGGSGGRVTIQAPGSIDHQISFALYGGFDSSLGVDMDSCSTGSSGTMLWLSASASYLLSDNDARLGKSVSMWTELDILNELHQTYIYDGATVAMVDIDSVNNTVDVKGRSALIGYNSIVTPSTMNMTEGVFCANDITKKI